MERRITLRDLGREEGGSCLACSKPAEYLISSEGETHLICGRCLRQFMPYLEGPKVDLIRLGDSSLAEEDLL